MSKSICRALQPITYPQLVNFTHTDGFTVAAGTPIITNLIAEKVGILAVSDIATKTELGNKSDVGHTHSIYVLKTNAVLSAPPADASDDLSIPTTHWTRGRIDEAVLSAGAGDMSKSTYDTNNDGIVDKAMGLWNGTTTLAHDSFAKLSDINLFANTQIIKYGDSSTNGLLTFKDTDNTTRGSVYKLRDEAGHVGIAILNAISNEIFIVEDTGGITLKSGSSFYNVWTAKDLTPVDKAGDTMTGALNFTFGTAGDAVEILNSKPTDYGTGKPAFIIKRSSTNSAYEIILYDGVDNSGSIIIKADSLQIGAGNTAWHSGNFTPSDYALVGHSHTEYLNKNTGGTMAAQLIFGNNIAISGTKTDSSVKNLVILNASNNIEIGDITVPIILNSSITPKTKIGALTYDIWHSGNLTPSDYALTGHTHTNATQSIDGFLSHLDKTKLDSIAADANNYVHPATHASSMITTDTTNFDNILTVADDTLLKVLNTINDHTHDGSYLALSGTATDSSKLENHTAKYFLRTATQTLTSIATTSLNVETYDNFIVTLNQNTTFAFLNLSTRIGGSGTIVIKQDSTGGHTFTLPSEAKTPNGDIIAQDTVANHVNTIMYFIIDASTVLINYVGNWS